MYSFIDRFRDRRQITVFLFGIASGLPWIMIGSVMSAWLKDEGLSRSAIGLFGLIFGVYSINFLWSPLIDSVKLPLSTKIGRRKSWIFLLQLGIALCCIAIAQMNITQHLWWFAFSGLVIAIFSATQDIAIDAYRIDIIGEDKEAMTASSSMATAGWWTGYGGLGALPFFLADHTDWYWPETYYVLAVIMLFLSTVTLFARETPKLEPLSSTPPNNVKHWLTKSLVQPFQEFFERNGMQLALLILLFIFSFKIGEAFLGRMSIVFYKEIGFSNSEIGTYSKLVNWWVTIFFAVVGGIFTIKSGIYKGLIVAGIAMAASNLMFAWIAQVGPSPSLFVAAVIIDGFTGAWSTVAMVAFISLLCNHHFSASQYALMASLSSLGRTVLAGSSGWLVDWLDGNWTLFFIITTLMVIPALLLLRYLKPRVAILNENHSS